jgi:ribosome biogenesis GTPase A
VYGPYTAAASAKGASRCHTAQITRPSHDYNEQVLSRVLAPSAEQQLNETRSLLSDLREALTRAPATDQDARTLGTAITQLDDFFLLVVVGEFNAGKSAFINALVGERVLDEGVTPSSSVTN